MDLREAIRRRRSVRSYSDKIPSRRSIKEIIEYANLAPSAGNLQARDFVIIDDYDISKKLSSAAFNQIFIAQAPINIVVCANLKRASSYGKRGEELYSIQDASIAVEHILLLAVDNGLDTCWIGAFDENKVSQILGLPSYARPISIIPIGYSDERKTHTSRKDITELTHFNNW